ncbi:MAG TPA: CRISPR-associated RAMP protein Csx10 [Dehalococcoidia bacterium]|nr:CRISPR-associated RAMP protein Csx10 [Dehalococcoidia bacterium]
MWLLLKPEEPLLLGDVRGDSQFLAGRAYVPGRVLRGALALDMLREGKTSSELMQIVTAIRIWNFFPAPGWHRIEYALPLPLTAATCKTNPGFVHAPSPATRGHGVIDWLIPFLAYRLLQQAGAQFRVPFMFECAREDCRARMESSYTFYSVHRQDGQILYVAVEPVLHAQTRVALSRHRQASFEGMLYTASALAPQVKSPDEQGTCPIVFVGRVEGEAWAIDRLREALSRTAIGAMHNRGYGRVRVEDCDIHLPPLAERLEAFNNTLAQLWNDLRRLAVNTPDRVMPEGTYFTLDLLSPAVFLTDGVPSLRPTLVVGDAVLEPLLWVTRPDIASGWSTAWGLPKPTNLAARMGSVYVFCWMGDKHDLISALTAIEQQGIGERTDEGFGECIVCHPFHQEVKER